LFSFSNLRSLVYAYHYNNKDIKKEQPLSLLILIKGLKFSYVSVAALDSLLYAIDAPH